jgi:NAD-dependent dihydropyrimidine dehydrogenase PreA subunit
VHVGGPCGGCIPAELIDMPFDFELLEKSAGSMGSAGLVVLDESVCMVELARYFNAFTQEESCGKCIPCREGTYYLREILHRIVAGKGEAADIDILEKMSIYIRDGSLCSLGALAPNPIMSTVKYFRGEYEAHIFGKRCPTQSCKELKMFLINPSLCTCCDVCRKKCPVHAIAGSVQQPYAIDQIRCIKCGECLRVCPSSAVEEH